MRRKKTKRRRNLSLAVRNQANLNHPRRGNLSLVVRSLPNLNQRRNPSPVRNLLNPRKGNLKKTKSLRSDKQLI
jgi:hypothetical protein